MFFYSYSLILLAKLIIKSNIYILKFFWNNWSLLTSFICSGRNIPPLLILKVLIYVKQFTFHYTIIIFRKKNFLFVCLSSLLLIYCSFDKIVFESLWKTRMNMISLAISFFKRKIMHCIVCKINHFYYENNLRVSLYFIIPLKTGNVHVYSDKLNSK